MKEIKYKRVAKSGSINIPIDIRRELDIQGGDGIEIQKTQEGKLVLSRYRPRCHFCQSDENVMEASGNYICRKCAQAVYEVWKEHGNETK